MEKPEGKYLGNIGADGRIILKRISKKEDGNLRDGLICLGMGRNLAGTFYIHRAARNDVN
jgi:hypothetical protein